MDVFPKFIIETDAELGDCLVIAKCTYHNQLVTDKTKVKGGGWWRLDKNTNTFILYGDSYEYGKAKLENVESCIKAGHVYSNSSLAFPIVDKHNFAYDTGSIIIDIQK